MEMIAKNILSPATWIFGSWAMLLVRADKGGTEAGTGDGNRDAIPDGNPDAIRIGVVCAAVDDGVQDDR